MFTAAEARELSGPTIEEKVEALLVTVKEQAQKGKRSVKTGWEHKAHEELWENCGYKGTDEWKAAKKILEDLGFTVKFHYQEHSIAVDMYTLITW